MKKNILVFPCGSEIGLDIYSSVRYSTHFNLIGGSSTNDHGKFVYKNYIGNIPTVTSDDFLEYLKDLIKKYSIDAIYPTMDLVIAKLKGKEEYLNCKVISSPYATTEICLSKRKTYDILKNVIRVPEVFKLEELRDFPIIAKPNIGYGARGIKLLKNKEDASKLNLFEEDYIFCEYLPGEEYTVDCFTDYKGELLYCNARKRNRIKGGISVNTSFEKRQEEFYDIARKLNSNLKFNGAWFFQVKRDKEEQLCLLEIAARLGGSSLLSRAIGVNLALLSIFNEFGVNVTVSPNSYNVELDRALGSRYTTDIKYDRVYVDFDDCLVLDNSRVNIEIISFLYKCRNEKKHITLLSKHAGDLDKELHKFAIYQIFDEIIHLSPDDDKSKYIVGNAIFIDDSNSERLNIATKLNIPVFAPDMIDVLL